MKTSSIPRIASRLALIAVGFALSVPLSAQQLEEIVVTTRQKEENLQKVPIAVDVITSAEIERQGLTTLDDIVRLSSSLQFQTGFSPQDTQLTIRGLSPERGRVNVAVLLDGVDITSESIETIGGSLLIDPELFDLERIEVVKGPQNALYGRSAFAGAISYITRKPSNEFASSASVDIGSYGQAKANGRVSGPLVADTLYGGLAGTVYTHDGFYSNSITGDDVGGRDGYALAGSLVWDATDALKFTGQITYSDDDFEVAPWGYYNPNKQYPIPQSAIDAGVVPSNFPRSAGNVADLLQIPGLIDLQPGFVPGPSGTFPDGDDVRATMSEDPLTCADPTDVTTCDDFPDGSREVTRYQLNADWDLGPVILTSITHVANAEVEQFHDGNSTGSTTTLPFISQVRFYTDTDLLSQELRVQSGEESPLNWTVGALYWKEEVDQQSFGDSCIAVLHDIAPADATGPFGPIPLVPCGPFSAEIGPGKTYTDYPENWFRDTTHWSAYFLVDIPLFSDDLTLTLEGRYVDEDMDIGGPDGDTVIDPVGLGFNMPNTGCVESPFAPPGFSCLNDRPTGVISDEEAKAAGAKITKDEDNYFVPKATLRWEAADNQMYYFSVARAAKPSGISGLTGGVGAFNPFANQFEREERTVYELGAKTSWADNRVILNGAVFFDDYDDKQVGTQRLVTTSEGGTPILTTVTENAASAEVFGIELESTWYATDYLTLFAGYTYLDTEWTDFEQVTTSPGTIAYGGNCRPITFDTDGDGTPDTTRCGVSFDGNDLENAPRHAFVGTFSYRRPFNSDIDWYIEGDSEYQDTRYTNPENTLELDSYWLFNFRAGIEYGQLEVQAYVDNAFDDDTIRMGFDSIDTRYLAADFSQGFTLLVPDGARFMLPDPRTFGVRAFYRFGGSE